MPLSVAAHDRMLTHFAGIATSVQLLRTINLEAPVSSGATVTLDTAVAAGDYISLNNRQTGNRETFEVITGGTTPTLSKPVTLAFEVNDPVGWAPKASTSLIRADASPRPMAWTTPATSEELRNNPTNTPEFEVGANNEIGSFALFDAQNVYLGSFLTRAIDRFGSGGRYILTIANVNLNSSGGVS